MRRSIIIGTGLSILVGAAVALAASGPNTYTVSIAFHAKKGSKAKPSPLTYHEVWGAHGTNGNDAAPITKIVEKFYGVVSHGGAFPTCTADMINSAGNSKGWNKVCPKGSLVAEGFADSLFVPANKPKDPGTPCHPYEYVYNAGQGAQTDFFAEYPYAPSTQYSCANGAVKTGAAAAYPVGVSEQGGYLVLTINVPAAESTSAGGLPGVYASTLKLDQTHLKVTKKVHGKTVAYLESVACKKGKRPWSYTFTAQNYQGQSPSSGTSTVSGSEKC